MVFLERIRGIREVRPVISNGLPQSCEPKVRLLDTRLLASRSSDSISRRLLFPGLEVHVHSIVSIGSIGQGNEIKVFDESNSKNRLIAEQQILISYAPNGITIQNSAPERSAIQIISEGKAPVILGSDPFEITENSTIKVSLLGGGNLEFEAKITRPDMTAERQVERGIVRQLKVASCDSGKEIEVSLDYMITTILARSPLNHAISYALPHLVERFLSLKETLNRERNENIFVHSLLSFASLCLSNPLIQAIGVSVFSPIVPILPMIFWTIIGLKKGKTLIGDFNTQVGNPFLRVMEYFDPQQIAIALSGKNKKQINQVLSCLPETKAGLVRNLLREGVRVEVAPTPGENTEAELLRETPRGEGTGTA